MRYFRHIHIKTAIFAGLLFLILVYTYFQMQSLITGPVISIKTPSNGAVLSDPLVDIEGSAKNISRITMNDRQIFIDESGVFKEKLLLSPGYNIITLQAEDRFGRDTKSTLDLVYN